MLVITNLSIPVCDLGLLFVCTGLVMAAAFTILACLVCGWFVALLLFLLLDEDCNPGLGDCGRPLRLWLFVVLKMVNGGSRFVHWRLDY